MFISFILNMNFALVDLAYLQIDTFAPAHMYY